MWRIGLVLYSNILGVMGEIVFNVEEVSVVGLVPLILY